MNARAIVIIRYTNYRGETADRRILPKSIRFGSTQWHPEEQWLLDAFDVDRGADRCFALKDVLHWTNDHGIVCAPQLPGLQTSPALQGNDGPDPFEPGGTVLACPEATPVS
jgi:hypothetical protein